MLFSEIKGLEDVKDRLVQSVRANQIAHAQLFCGEEGSANLALALAYATFLNCTNRGAQDACGECAACQKNGKLIHPDLHFVFPVSATAKVKGKEVVSQSFLKSWRQFISEERAYGSVMDWSAAFGGENKQLNISKEESRQILQKLALKSFEGQYKIMLIWLPEFMHPAAANGILKILEEPPAYTVFLLVTEHKDQLLSTILSRVQLVQVRNFTDEEIRLTLMQETSCDEKKVYHAASLANGSLHKAYGLLREVEDDNQQLFRQWMRLCYIQDYTQLIVFSEDFHKMSKDTQKNFLLYALSVFREALIAHVQSPELFKSASEDHDFIKKFSKIMTPAKIHEVSHWLSQYSYYLERNASAKIQFMSLSLHIVAATHHKDKQYDMLSVFENNLY